MSESRKVSTRPSERGSAKQSVQGSKLGSMQGSRRSTSKASSKTTSSLPSKISQPKLPQCTPMPMIPKGKIIQDTFGFYKVKHRFRKDSKA